ncbi:hypothetical protein BJV74DRAFT_605649 [Russula compacta]|nr:hypothetical protein BJV74DRAFT_605649 [Russula compacta]
MLWLETSRPSILRNPVLRHPTTKRRPSRGLSGKAPRPPWNCLDREQTMYATKLVSGDDRNRPEYDPLCLSAQQSRLVCQTWTSPPAASTVRSPDGERRTSSRSEHRQCGARPDSTMITADLPRDHFIFRHLESIEKTVDERMRKRKIQKEWSARMIAETARLIRDEAGLESMHGERPHRSRDADIVHVDTFDDHYLRTPQPMEQVPTSQSQERYIHLSPMAPTGDIDARCVPIDDDDHVDVAGNLCDHARSECHPVGRSAALSGPSNRYVTANTHLGIPPLGMHCQRCQQCSGDTKAARYLCEC